MIVVEGPRSFWVGTPATLVASNGNAEVAWAEPHIRHDPHLRWILGRYVEAESANKNGHIFPLEDLPAAVATIQHQPLNMLHHPSRLVGHYAAAELLYPTTMEGAAAAGQQPFVEALAAFYAFYFPEVLAEVEKAYNQGVLAFSMECTPEQLGCPACGWVGEYVGRASPTYCPDMSRPAAPKRLIRPRFSGGGLILPPASPAWPRADITQLSAWMSTYAQAEAASVYDQVVDEFPHLDWRSAETMMSWVLAQASAELEGEYGKRYSGPERMKLAKENKALPDGSYPIEDATDLKNAIILCRSGHGDDSAAKQLIIRRARALGLTNMLPDDWK